MALTLALTPLAAVAIATLRFGVAISDVTRDVASIGQLHPLAGILSSLGILLWWTSASLWLFLAAVHRKARSNQAFRFAVASGLLSAYLTFDDLFQFHEALAPRYLGVPEPLAYAALVAVVAAYLFIFRRRLLRSDGAILALAIALLASAMASDLILWRSPWPLGQWARLIEDGLKWSGIVGWCLFCVVRCRAELATGEEREVSHPPPT